MSLHYAEVSLQRDWGEEGSSLATLVRGSESFQVSNSKTREGVSTVCCLIMNRRVYKGCVCVWGGGGGGFVVMGLYVVTLCNYLLAVKHPQCFF